MSRRDKRQSEPSRGPSPSFRQSLWDWWRELPPWMSWLIVGLATGGIILLSLPPSLVHTFNCQVRNLPQNYRSSNGYFIDNQVIVVGPENQVANVIKALPAVTLTSTSTNTPTGTPAPADTPTNTPTNTPINTPATTTTPQFGTQTATQTLAALATPTTTGTLPAPETTSTPGTSSEGALKLVEGCDLSYLDTRKDAASNAALPPRQLVMQLYEIPEGSSVDTVIAKINQAKINTLSLSVSVDPNYLTRLSDTTTDPCIRNGDGGSGGGHPFGDPGTGDPAKTRAAFTEQWAYGPDGIDLKAFRASNPGLTGRGVRVGVFDTSPFRRKLPFFGRLGGKLGDVLPSPLWFTNWDAGGTTMLSSHGLFVAELIYGIAPQSHIHLVRVLNEDGCGDLWMLNTGLNDFISHMSAWTGKLDKTVLNMSLGFRLINNTDDSDTGSEHDTVGSEENDNQAEAEASPADREAPDLVNEDAETLRSLLKTANDMGAIIFAAAGNGPAPENPRGEHLEMEVPASDPNVYGIAATNKDGGPSCYTNKGEIAAPGGEGGINPNKLTDSCASRPSTWDQEPGPNNGSDPACNDMATCPFGLISLIQTRYGPQYALWSGTSFATPLVSGMAALGFQRMNKQTVVCLIQGGDILGTDPVLGTGLIKIGDLTNPTIISNCP
jgi:subtilase family protein